MADSKTIPDHPDEGVFTRFVLGFWATSGVWARVATLLAAVVCFIGMTIFANAVGVPPLARFTGSLLNQSSATAWLTVVVGLVVCTLLGTFLAGAVRFDAGLFAATVGLATLSLGGGTMENVIYDGGGISRVFFNLAMELVILAAVVTGLWAMLLAMGRSRLFALARLPEAAEESSQDQAITINDCLFAAAVNAVVFTLLMLLLCRSEAKYQCLAAVGISSLISAVSVHHFFPVRPSSIFWAGPLVVGIIGYLIAGWADYPGVGIGQITGTFAALARPLPLDYASVGVACSIMGYWMSRHAEQTEEE